jgi:hypothetical protein
VNGWEDHYKEKSFLYQCKVCYYCSLLLTVSLTPRLIDSLWPTIGRKCVGGDQPVLRSSASLCCHRSRHLLHPWRYSSPSGGPRERHPSHLEHAQRRCHQSVLRTRDRGEPTGDDLSLSLSPCLCLSLSLLTSLSSSDRL